MIALTRDDEPLLEQPATLADIKTFFKGSNNGVEKITATLTADFDLVDVDFEEVHGDE